MNLEEWLEANPDIAEEMDSAYEALYTFIEHHTEDIPEDIAEVLAKALDEGYLSA